MVVENLVNLASSHDAPIFTKILHYLLIDILSKIASGILKYMCIAHNDRLVLLLQHTGLPQVTGICGSQGNH